MKRKWVLVPSVLTKSKTVFHRHILESLAFAGTVHIDVQDQTLTPYRSASRRLLQDLRLPARAIIHLMVRDPVQWLEAILRCGARRVIIHAEIPTKRLDVAEAAFRAAGLKVGLAIPIQRDPAKILAGRKPAWIHLTLGPIGKNGRGMSPNALDQIRSTLKRFPRAHLSADVGLNPATIPDVVRAGVTEVTVGSYLWDSSNHLLRLRHLRSLPKRL